MSRTYAHRPYWAWFADRSVCVADHDHRERGCDLPPLPVWLDRIKSEGWPAAYRATSCRWQVDRDRIPPPCGCRMCTGHDDRKADRRRDRRATRAQLRQLTARR